MLKKSAFLKLAKNHKNKRKKLNVYIHEILIEIELVCIHLYTRRITPIKLREK